MTKKGQAILAVLLLGFEEEHKYFSTADFKGLIQSQLLLQGWP